MQAVGQCLLIRALKVSVLIAVVVPCLFEHVCIQGWLYLNF